MDFQTYNTEEFLTRSFAVNNMPELRPEDGTNMFDVLRPHTVDVIFHRSVGQEWEVFRVDVLAYRVRKQDGRNSLQTRTVRYHGNAFSPQSHSSVPSWLKDWVLEQAP